MSDLLRADDVAKILGKKPVTLAKWRILRRGPPWIKVGGAVMYRTEGVNRWLDQNRIDPAQMVGGRA